MKTSTTVMSVLASSLICGILLFPTASAAKCFTCISQDVPASEEFAVSLGLKQIPPFTENCNESNIDGPYFDCGDSPCIDIYIESPEQTSMLNGKLFIRGCQANLTDSKTTSDFCESGEVEFLGGLNVTAQQVICHKDLCNNNVGWVKPCNKQEQVICPKCLEDDCKPGDTCEGNWCLKVKYEEVVSKTYYGCTSFNPHRRSDCFHTKNKRLQMCWSRNNSSHTTASPVSHQTTTASHGSTTGQHSSATSPVSGETTVPTAVTTPHPEPKTTPQDTTKSPVSTRLPTSVGPQTTEEPPTTNVPHHHTTATPPPTGGSSTMSACSLLVGFLGSVLVGMRF